MAALGVDAVVGVTWWVAASVAGAPGYVVRTLAGVVGGAGRGWAVQVDPIKPTLKAPGPQPLKLKRDALLSSLAFEFNLRRSTEASTKRAVWWGVSGDASLTGAYTRPLLSST